jgi:hypothetical protein
MYKLILFMMLMVYCMTATALQFDEEVAIRALFQAKHSVNYAAHAASQQIDGAKLARGIHSIDAALARQVAERYLRENMRLDENNDPLPDSFFRSRVNIAVFEVINENHAFPYTYENSAYDYRVTLQRPGVVLIIEVEFPRTYRVLGPITWRIKGCSELVYE